MSGRTGRRNPSVSVAPAADPASGRPVAPRIDALRLLRLVHIRRELRLTWHISAIAAIVWGTANIAVEGRVDPDSVWYDRAETIGIEVFVLLLAVFVVALLAQVLLRYAGAAGQAAAGLAPVIGVPDDPVITDGRTAIAGLWPRLRRRAYVSFGGALLVLLFTFGVVATAVAAGPAWQANHGRGGTVVVIGRDATIAYSQEHVSSAGTHRDYYLDTPVGTVIAEDGTPQPGQQWVVVDNPLGRGEAYRVGAHDYLLVGFCLVFFVLFDLVAVGVVVAGAVTERGRRRDAGHTPLVDSVGRLASGDRARIAAGRIRLNLFPRTQTYGRQVEYDIGLPPLGDRTAEQVLARRRWAAAAVALVVVVATAGGATAYGRERFAAQPPQDRTVRLTELTGTGWQPAVFADYGDGTADGGFADALDAAGGGSVTSTWTMVVTPSAAPEHGLLHPDAYVEVYRTRNIRPARLTSALLACAVEERCQPIHPLPAGWGGSVSHDSMQTEATVVAAQPGTVVVVTVVGNEAGSLQLSTAQLRGVVTRLTGALARIGVAPLAARTARPAA